MIEKRNNHTMSGYVWEELIDNIFKTLPPKSLLRFRCLSKSWCSRIGSPDFIRTHALRFDKNLQKVLVKHWTYDKRRGMEEFFTLHPENRLPLSHRHGYTGIGKFPCNDCCIVGSCNGLLCLFHHEIGTIALWNPSIRHQLTLPPHPYTRNYSPQSPRVALGFGFDPVTDDYKIVRISYYTFKRVEPTSMVYTINTGTWRVIASPTTRLSNVQCSACFVNGALHWIVTEQDNKDHCYIMSFGLSTEVFGRVLLPEPGSEARELTTIKDSLAVITGECHNPRIWVMREDNNVASWSMFFNLEALPGEGGIHRVLLLTTNRDLVFLIYCEGYKVYNPATGVLSRLVKFNAGSYQLEVETYAESLVLLNKGTACNGNQPPWLQSKKRKQNFGVSSLWH
ncbi:F-box associated domain, type 1 [Cynara cardunculus var. scolymus]|uniref:F-box associated domain, type 1 n=1 Tax=Cynara cardunculus var. scolymus TaxID=59895 RepID=A0A118JW27_CYNCS|nr:F-box associated domain, type 1 [Cynara cardunculus var. scolymus]